MVQACSEAAVLNGNGALCVGTNALFLSVLSCCAFRFRKVWLRAVLGMLLGCTPLGGLLGALLVFIVRGRADAKPYVVRGCVRALPARNCRCARAVISS